MNKARSKREKERFACLFKQICCCSRDLLSLPPRAPPPFQKEINRDRDRKGWLENERTDTFLPFFLSSERRKKERQREAKGWVRAFRAVPVPVPSDRGRGRGRGRGEGGRRDEGWQRSPLTSSLRHIVRKNCCRERKSTGATNRRRRSHILLLLFFFLSVGGRGASPNLPSSCPFPLPSPFLSLFGVAWE